MTPASPARDEAAMLELQRGRDLALNELMERWQLPLRSFLYRWTQNEADALDLAQETFVRVYQQRARYRAGARFSTWLFQIALNLARDRARRVKRRPTSSLELATEVADETTPKTDLTAREQTAAVRAAIANLPDELRTAVLLSEYEEKSHAEIGEIVGATAKAIETRLYRARAQLRKSLHVFLKAG